MKKNLFKLLSMALVACLVLSLGVSAFADEDPNEAYANDEDVSKTVEGPVDYAGANAWNGNSADMTVNGNVEASGTDGDDYVTSVYAYAYGEGSAASATVNGNVSASSVGGEQPEWWDPEWNGEYVSYAYATGVYTEGEFGGSGVSTVNGDVTASADAERAFAYGVYASSDGNNETENYVAGKADVKVTGSVDVKASGEEYAYSYGVEAYSNGGEITVQVDKDVTVAANGADPQAVGIYAYSDSEQGATVNVKIGGNLTVTSENKELYYSAAAIVAGAYGKNAETTVEVGGDVTSSDAGIYVYQGEDGKVNVVVGGTVTGENAGILYEGEEFDAENISITVWEIKTGEDGKLVAAGTEDYDEEAGEPTFVENEELTAAIEKAINYIIKTDFADVDASLSGVTEIAGYQTAHEGDKVSVKIESAEGYSVTVSNNGTALLQDADGSFYLLVPKGGGVYLVVNMVRNNPALLFTSQAFEGPNGEVVYFRVFEGGYFVLGVDGEGVLCGYVLNTENGLVFRTTAGVENTLENGVLTLTVGETDYALAFSEEELAAIEALAV